jgi:hypothetical protein
MGAGQTPLGKKKLSLRTSPFGKNGIDHADPVNSCKALQPVGDQYRRTDLWRCDAGILGYFEEFGLRQRKPDHWDDHRLLDFTFLGQEFWWVQIALISSDNKFRAVSMALE